MSSKAERFAALQAGARGRAGEHGVSTSCFPASPGKSARSTWASGTGALAHALAPRVREVVALEIDAAMAERARADAPANVEVVVGDGEHLPFDDFSFDLAATLQDAPSHPAARAPDRRAGPRGASAAGSLLVVDQLAPVDPLEAFELNRFERARDPSTTRVLAEGDLRALFDANGLVLHREDIVHEPRDLDAYLDLAGCEGFDRERAHALAPPGYEGVLGWFVLGR